MMTQTVPRLSGSVLLGLLIAAIWFLADQVSKWWIINSVMRPPQVIPVTEFFNLVLGHNTGVSFGLFGDASPWMLIALTLAIDRKSVVSGKSVSVRVDIGGRRLITKKIICNKYKYTDINTTI